MVFSPTWNDSRTRGSEAPEDLVSAWAEPKQAKQKAKIRVIVVRIRNKLFKRVVVAQPRPWRTGCASVQGAQIDDHIHDVVIVQYPLIGWHGIFSILDRGQ